MKRMSEISAILAKAERGEPVSPHEALKLIDPDQTGLDELIETANRMTRRVFGNEIGLCAIYPAKVGACSGDCAFCAQSARHSCNVSPVKVSELDESAIVQNAQSLWDVGVRRYSLVTSGERLTDAEFERILAIFQKLRAETKIGLCASLGSLKPERAKKLKDAGVSRYHHNIETSRSYFPKICSTHSYADKLRTIDIARGHGMEICCGGIIAMGETPAQRVEMAFELKALNIDCVPINILNPIPGTRLENQAPLSVDEILRSIAVFRIVLPDKALRFAGGREKAMGNYEINGFQAGINAILAGNYLTTDGKALERELKNLEAAGYTVEQ